MTTDSRSIETAFAQSSPIAPTPRPELRVVSARFALVQPDEPAPAEWQAGLDALLDWLRLDADVVSERDTRSRARLPGWGKPAAAVAPVFAPWLAWSPAAFQQGGLAGLPRADWAVSYLADPGTGLGGPAQRGIDLALMSPLPSACVAEDAGGVPVPRAGVLRAMLAMARTQGRSRIAVICPARQRNAIARQLLVADRALTREGAALDVITIEDALRPLMAGAAPWDAVIAMPEVRSIVFTLLAETTCISGPWPMAWHRQAPTGTLIMVSSEGAGDGQRRIALDASTLVQGLALICHASGIRQAARRLHDAWSRLRDAGAATAMRGACAPYAKQVSDAEFVRLLTRDARASKRSVAAWRALGEAMPAQVPAAPCQLRIVSANPLSPLASEGRHHAEP